MTLNPYQSPCFVAPDDCRATIPNPGDRSFRLLAGILLLGALMWGALCAVFVAMNPLRGLLIFGPGYLVLAAYVWRAFLPCPGVYPKAIWGLSLVVQGTWLALCATAAFMREPQVLFNPVGIWWILSSLASLGGLIYDGHWSIRSETKPW